MRFERELSLAGGSNTNYLRMSQRGPQLQRVQRVDRDLIKEWQHSIYPFMGFFQDGGKLHIRTPQEQYDFSKRASVEGLRVLPPDEIVRGTIYSPYLPDAQHLDVYLRNHPSQQERIVTQLFTDLRKAHAKDVIYGDRCGPNILVTKPLGKVSEIVHIDFDFEITGPTAKELEVAEVARAVLSAGESTIPILSRQLGTRHPWFDLDMACKYLDKYARHWQRDRFRITPGDLVEQLITHTYALRDKKATLPILNEFSFETQHNGLVVAHTRKK